MWANAQDSLGVVLSELGALEGGSEGIEHIKEAVTAFRAALQVRTREADIHGWARTQGNLGIALRRLGNQVGGHQGLAYFTKAIEAFEKPLTVFNQRYYPRFYVSAAENRSKVYKKPQALSLNPLRTSVGPK